MHYSSTAALVAFSSLGVTYAAPFVNPYGEVFRRKANYDVVNVDGESSSSAAPEVETVTQTVKSQVTAPGAPAVPVTVTITATPSTKASSSARAHSSPLSHIPPPPGASFFPPSNDDFLGRDFNPAGIPANFAQGPGSSSPVSAPVAPTSFAARQAGGQWTPSAVPSGVHPSPSVAPRQNDGQWTPSAVPSGVVPTPSVAPRQNDGQYTPSPAAPEVNPASLPAGQNGASSSPAHVAPSSPGSVAPTVAPRQHAAWEAPAAAAPSSAAPSAVAPSSLVARQFGAWPTNVPSLAATPTSHVQSAPISATPLAAPRQFDGIPSGIPLSAPSLPTSLVARQANDGQWHPNAAPSSATPTPSFSRVASASLPASAIPMAY